MLCGKKADTSQIPSETSRVIGKYNLSVDTVHHLENVAGYVVKFIHNNCIYNLINCLKFHYIMY